MKFMPNDPPRVFTVGQQVKFDLKDCAHIELEANEQVTFKTQEGHEYDVARKEWGFYATPSLNGRLPKFHLRPVLIKNLESEKYYVVLVEESKEKEFKGYLKIHSYVIICRLDDEKELKVFERKIAAASL